MNSILLTLGSLTLGGSAAILLLALAGRSTRGRYGAKWRCWGWLLLCLRLAECDSYNFYDFHFNTPFLSNVQTSFKRN